MIEHKLNIRGVEWKYATVGERERPAILMFHGAVGGGESMQWLADALADEYRSIAPTIAPVGALEEVCDAASAILDREHVGRAVVFGDTFGAMIAQAFLKRRPRQVEHLILLGAGAPDAALAAKNGRTLRLIKWLPFGLTRALMKAELSRPLTAPEAVEAETRVRVEAFRRRLDDFFDHALTKEILLSRLRLAIEFNRDEAPPPTDEAGRSGRALIIESDDDPLMGEAERRRLRALYPRAFICAFEGAGHLIPLLRAEELIGVIKAFVKESYAPPPSAEHCPLHEESAAH